MTTPHSPQSNKKRPWWLAGGAASFYLLTAGKNLLNFLKFGKFAAPVISMFVSIGAYALIFPFSFSVGLVSMILIHELGHIWAAKRRGLPVSAPMFIPFVGAFIALKRSPRDAVTEAYIALGGPLLGTFGALVAFLLGLWTRQPIFIVAAYLGFFLNLLNLLPIHPLDGGRIATAVTRWLWLVGLVAGLLVIIYLRSPLFFIIWLWFAWSLGRKYVWKKKEVYKYSFAIERSLTDLLFIGSVLPGVDHRRDLRFETFSTLDGVQKVVVHWEALGIEQVLSLSQQSLIKRVQVEKIAYAPDEQAPETMVIHGAIEHSPHENDAYYEVPYRTRWIFGIVYGGLALLLGSLMVAVQNLSAFI